MNCVQYHGLGYSNRFVWLCRVCALYPHYGALPPSSTLELVPQEPRNSYHRSGLGLLQRDRPTACLPYRITRHTSQVMPWVALCPPDTPAIAWQLTIAWSINFVLIGDGPNNITGSQDYCRLPDQGSRTHVSSSPW